MPAWIKGQSGNPKGRKPGPLPHRRRYEAMFWADLYGVWKEHGLEAIEHVRTQDPTTFVKICASVLPRSEQEHAVNHAHQIEVILKPPAWLSDNRETNDTQPIDITPQSNDDESSA